MVLDKLTDRRSYIGPSYPNAAVAAAIRDSYKLREHEAVMVVREIPGLEIEPPVRER
jgi:hypothetical protein